MTPKAAPRAASFREASIADIRRLTLADTAAAAMVMRRSFDERLPTFEALHTPDEDAAFVRDHLFPKVEMWGAFGPDLAGFIAFADGWIEQFYILPEYQGHGLGRTLLAIPKSKFPELRLWTFQQNRSARQFYERQGFVAIEHTDGRGNEHGQPDVLYRWESTE